MAAEHTHGGRGAGPDLCWQAGGPAAPLLQGGEDLHQLHLHGHAHGEEHAHGARLPQAQGLLQGQARPRVPGQIGSRNDQFISAADPGCLSRIPIPDLHQRI